MSNPVTNVRTLVNTSLDLSTDNFERTFLSSQTFSHMSQQLSRHSTCHGLQIVQVDGTASAHSRSSSSSSSKSYAFLDEEYCPPPRMPRQASSIRSSQPSLASPTSRSSHSSLYESSFTSHSRSTSDSSSSSITPPMPIASLPKTPVSYIYDISTLDRRRSIASSPWTCLEGAHHPLCGGSCDAGHGSLQKVLRSSNSFVRASLTRRRSLGRLRSMMSSIVLY